MIYADASELSSNSRFRRVMQNVKSCPELEQLTGADLLITRTGMPVNDCLIAKHIEAGAILVQLKFGSDLTSSITDGRLKDCIERMRIAPYASQRRLIYIGILAADKRGNAQLDGQTSHMSYTSVIRALDRFQHRGGTYTNVYHERWLPQVLADMEQEMMRFGVEEEWFPSAPTFESDDVLEPTAKVSDWRPALAAIPGIGPVKATNLRDAMLEADAADCYAQALVWAAADKHERKEMRIKIPLWGDRTHRAVREFILGGDLDFGEEYSMRLKFEYQKVSND